MKLFNQIKRLCLFNSLSSSIYFKLQQQQSQAGLLGDTRKELGEVLQLGQHVQLGDAGAHVTGGDPQASYLQHKLDGTHALEADLGGCGCGGSGGLMPAGARMLDAGLRDRVRSWIEQGAPQ